MDHKKIYTIVSTYKRRLFLITYKNEKAAIKAFYDMLIIRGVNKDDAAKLSVGDKRYWKGKNGICFRLVKHLLF